MRLFCAAVALLGWVATAKASEPVDGAELAATAAEASDLVFPTEPSSPTDMASPRMALFKPDGAGPFPALVLFHQCGGLGQANRPNLAMLNWARLAVAKGYVVLLIDALESRRVDTVCLGPKNGVVFARGVKDAFQAARHLRGLPFVQTDKVALAGYSWGAMVGLLAASRGWTEVLGPDDRFRAVVSMYPGCFTIRPRFTAPYDTARDDIETPLLVLMGGQDTETPAQSCMEKLEPVRAAGAPVEWHLYPGATHCWDCVQLDGMSKIDIRGSRVVYHYDRDTTLDSAERMFGFLERTLR